MCIEGGHVQESSVMAIRHIVHSDNQVDEAIDEESEVSVEDREPKRRRIDEAGAIRIHEAVSRAASTERECWTFASDDERAVEEVVRGGSEEGTFQGTSIEIYMQERAQEFAIWKESEKVRDNTLLTEIFEKQLASWSEGCVYCRMSGREHDHEGACPLHTNKQDIYKDRKSVV